MRKKKMLAPELGITGIDLVKEGTGLRAFIFRLIDGEVVGKGSPLGQCYPLVEQKIYGEQLCKFLNHDINFDKGSWQVVFTRPKKSYHNKMTGLFHAWVPEIMECQFLDKDGDIQLVVEFEEDVWDLLDNFSFTEVSGLCTKAYEQYKEIEAAVDAKPHQKYSPANGDKVNDDSVYPDGLI